MRDWRIEFLEHAIELAHELRANTGAKPSITIEVDQAVIDSIAEICDIRYGAISPSPGQPEPKQLHIAGNITLRAPRDG